MGCESIVLLGVNHKTTPLAVREKLALTGGYDTPLEKLGKIDGLGEYYLLSTCNRVEILFTCQDQQQMRREVLDLMFAGNVTRKEVSSCIYTLEGKDAVQHLFLVASSLDSMIVGETQILGQLKDAFRHAADKKTTGLILNKLLHKSFSVAKRVRTETRIGASAVSIS
ncbi:MAG: glutamyl-tRNA reductase, partial [Desulfobulbus sp.]